MLFQGGIGMNICARQFTVLGATTYVNESGTIDDYRERPRNMYSFCLIISGVGHFVQKNQELTARPGDIVFSPIGSKFYIEWLGEPDRVMQSLHLIFPPMGNPFRLSYSQQIVGSTPELAADFDFIINNFADEALSLQVLSKFYGTVDTLFRMLAPDELPDASPVIQKARRFIEENCCRKLTIDEIASCCGLSRSYFQHLFKCETGMTPIEYKNRAAISIAERLISENSELSIEKVSELTGFESAAYFRRVFKRQTQKTPTSYKKISHSEEPNYRY